MAVSIQETVFPHVGNGVSVEFSYGCQIFSASDLIVYVNDEVTTTGFTINGVGSATGGTVSFSTAPADGVPIRLERIIKLERATDYQQNGDFLSLIVNRDFDRIWQALQRFNYFIGVSVGAAARVLKLGDADVNGSGAYRAQNNRIQDVADPVNDKDAANKNWTLSQLAATITDGAGNALLQLLANTTDSTKGAALIGFIKPDGSTATLKDLASQSGATFIRWIGNAAGAVATTLAKWMGLRVPSAFDFMTEEEIADVQSGTPTLDVTAAVQAFLTAIAGKRGYLPSGTFLCGPLIIYSDTHLFGHGTIKAKATLGNAEYLLRNPNIGSYLDNNITIEGITFDGNGVGAGGTQVRFAELVSLNRVTNLTLEKIVVKNVQYMGVGLGSNRKVLIRGCTFTDCGYSGTTTNGGSAVWCASATTDIPEDHEIIGNLFHSNRWHGLHFSVRRGVVKGNVFLNNKEAHIFQSRLLPNIDATDCVIDGNVFDGVTKHDISSHAIETGCHRLTITGNTIRNCDHGGIALTDVRGATITGNTISNFNALAGTHSGIDIISTSALGAQPERITIANNTFFDDRGTPLGYAAVAVSKWGSGAAVRSVTISNNNCSGTAWVSGKPVVAGAGTLGSGCATRWNNGAADNDAVIINFQTNAVTGAQSVTGIGFKPRRVELLTTSNNTARISQCNAVVGADGFAVYHSIASSTAGSYGYSSAGRTSACILLIDQAGATKVAANFTSFDDDGFTINITNATEQAYVRCVAYP